MMNDTDIEKFLTEKKIVSAEIDGVEIVLTFEDGSSFHCEPTFVGGFICEVRRYNNER